MHNTINNLMYGDKYVYIQNKTKNKDTPKSGNGISLFDKIDPQTRFPKYFQKYGNIELDKCT